ADVLKQQQAQIEAQRLYQDALGDTVEKQKAANASAQADLTLTEARLKVRQQQLRSLEALAKAIGDENLARYAQIEQKRIDIKLTEAKVLAMRAEAEGSIAVAQATREELKAKGELTPVKAAELDTSIKLARAKPQ